MSKQQGNAGFSAKDQAYMKKYVESHPDSRMAWYLLGKEYERIGEMNKARYCFNEAGDIYKAFENEPLPAEMAAEAEEKRQMIIEWKLAKNRRRKVLARTVGLTILLLLFGTLLVTGDADAPPSGKEQAASEESSGTNLEQPKEATKERIYLAKKGAAEEQGKLLAKILKAPLPARSSALIVEQEAVGRWKMWTQEPEPIYALEATDKARVTEITQLNAEDCECEDEQTKSKDRAATWAIDQEKRMMGRSILTAVLALGETPPAELKSLAGRYPDNWISGVDQTLVPFYKQAYVEWKALGAHPKQKGMKMLWEQVASQESTPFHEPMRIVVDKANHRLALISGDQILRNYAVGLGGKRTPEGEFVITEKVVNPNGSATGAFGSRGMTLSNTLYAIHGTDEPESMGKDQSLGCVRMLREDVEELFDIVPMGTKVTITSGVLPDKKLIPAKGRYHVPLTSGQDNPNKVYKWL